MPNHILILLDRERHDAITELHYLGVGECCNWSDRAESFESIYRTDNERLRSIMQRGAE